MLCGMKMVLNSLANDVDLTINSVGQCAKSCLNCNHSVNSNAEGFMRNDGDDLLPILMKHPHLC